MFSFRLKKHPNMSDYLSIYHPKYLPGEMVLCFGLRHQGSKENFKPLAKLKKGTYPINGSTAERSAWWTQLDEGKKKAKAAVRIMASEYDRAIKQLDRSHCNRLELESKIKSQEDELNSLRLRLQKQEQENVRLKYEVARQYQTITDQSENSYRDAAKIQSLSFKLRSLTEENVELKDEVAHQSQTITDQSNNSHRDAAKMQSLSSKLKKLKEENAELKDEVAHQSQTDLDRSFDSDLPVIPVGGTYRDVGMTDYFLNYFPDLQHNHSNYDFWIKIRDCLKLRCRPSEIIQAVLLKCPREARKAVEKNFSKKDWSEADLLNSETLWRLIKKLHWCISEALGPGTNQFTLYYFRTQTDDESFREYCQEKFKLYCSYGVDKTEPSQNDLHFLYNVIEKASKKYRNLLLQIPKNYNNMLQNAMILDSMLMEANSMNDCFNCGRSGHTKAQCRRPGGDAEADPNQCYTCGEYNHLAWQCWYGKNRM
ncbi:uncharacterized protein LOC134303592 [Trichomycterus rosablanca]|uniref:uncharacterized protein LOC134303592 n=1 Tax=Trichomycterus rosablanca TaxID=2290929 RepID=UPI002F35E2F1